MCCRTLQQPGTEESEKNNSDIDWITLYKISVNTVVTFFGTGVIELNGVMNLLSPTLNTEVGKEGNTASMK